MKAIASLVLVAVVAVYLFLAILGCCQGVRSLSNVSCRYEQPFGPGNFESIYVTRGLNR